VTRVLPFLLKFAIPGCLFVLAIVAFRVRSQFHRALRLRHPMLWESIGAGGGIGPDRLRYAQWFWSRGFDNIGDPEVGVLGSRLTGASILAIGLVLAWAGFAWLGGYFHAR